jgi:hypothetical protein
MFKYKTTLLTRNIIREFAVTQKILHLLISSRSVSTHIVELQVILEEYKIYDRRYIYINYNSSIKLYVVRHHFSVPQKSPEDILSGSKYFVSRLKKHLFV